MTELEACPSFHSENSNFRARDIAPPKKLVLFVTKLVVSQVAKKTEKRTPSPLRYTRFHCLSTNYLTYYKTHQNHDSKALDAMGIIPNYMGVLIHDNTYF